MEHYSSRYDRCPMCGNQKRTVSKICKRCQRQPHNLAAATHVTHDLITENWFSEFIGLFMGEGCAAILKNGSSYAINLVVKLRDDDKDIILDIQKRLGGNVLHDTSPSRRNNGQGNQMSWRVSNHNAAEVCGMILKYAQLPAKKLNDVRQCLDFYNWRQTIGYRLSDDDRQEAERRLQHLRQSRKYITE